MEPRYKNKKPSNIVYSGAMTAATALINLDAMSEKAMPSPPRGPGRVLFEDFLAPRGITSLQFGSRLDFSQREMDALLSGDTRVDAPLARKFAEILGTSVDFWLHLQAKADSYEARQQNTEPPRLVLDKTGIPNPFNLLK
ncbi:MAG TPA: hypothetical protein DCZ06_01090 [Alphaproteobacteria bacterium]|nr:hypothetical protein [Alphaproteobacteria bacterium]